MSILLSQDLHSSSSSLRKNYPPLSIHIPSTNTTTNTTTTTAAAEEHAQLDNDGGVEITLNHTSFQIHTGIFYKSTKQILHPLTALFKPGELWAIMGPSGCGKSTLLNLIANKLKSKNINGTVLVNGQPVTKEISRQFGYVMQDDVLFENLTVQETLEYVIRLRHGLLKSSDAIKKRVFDVAEELGILHCLQTRVGGFLTRGLSGGERKRVSIAIELLKEQSSVLLLDEPSSGLDSSTAYNILYTLRQLATIKNRVVLCTIHQPHSKMFKLFDKVLLLSQGQIIYMGSRAGVLEYFSSLGFPAPSHTNPSDHILELVTRDSRNSEFETSSQKRIDFFVKEYQGSSLKQENEEEVKDAIGKNINKKTSITRDRRSFTREIIRLITLSLRNFTDHYRARLPFIFRLVLSIGMALILGCFYWQMGDDVSSVYDRQGVLFFITIQQSIFAIFLVLNVFHAEKRIYMREHSQGLYSSPSYYAAKFISEMPLLLPVPILFAVIAYPMIGLRLTLPYFAISIACLVVITFTSQAMGFMISSISPTIQMANIITPLILSLLLLFGGLFVNIDNIPVYFEWIGFINYVRYGFEILMVQEFTNLPITCGANNTIASTGNGDASTALQCPLQNGNQVLAQMSMQDVNVTMNFMYLLTLTLAFHLISFFALRFLSSSWA